MTDSLPPIAHHDSQQEAVDQHLVSLLDPTSVQAEQYRALRLMLERVRGLKTLAVTSPGDGDGKTTTAINVAGSLAYAHEARIMIADLDLRAPSVGDRLGLGNASAGLVDAILDRELTLANVARRHSQFPIWVLPAGRSLAIPYELLKSPRLGDLLHEARQLFDYVVLDTPPLVPVPDSRLITDYVDGVLMVVAANRTPRKLLEEALNLVDPAKLLGIVFNGDDHSLPGYYKYYGKYYGSDRPTGRRRRTR